MQPLWKPAALVFTVLGLLSACGGEKVQWEGTDLSGVMPDLEFELINEDGDAVTESDYIGQPTLLFFGFTNCPDICPGTLASLSRAIDRLQADQQDDYQVLFVSVDPQRDTPDRLREYTSAFGPQFIGLTGTQRQLETLNKRMRATYGYGEPDENGFYNVSHSSAVYGFDAEGKTRVLIKSELPTDRISADLMRLAQL
ncbi:cytochrome c oxidase assembly protein [Saccharospirillum sp. MSK14-1]|uniref:SCO family protein n=1 Tax=Saccharospirillum sp. MSK14-1 TaxID=1897632 RepID=UPI000D34D30E|nr:SCO family protein [Saccharospirillum sp. MSK14-1]PTY36584.1 cytochrome c oxidase assembly protein [Saccharospirillum sp. MSK14-1]